MLARIVSLAGVVLLAAMAQTPPANPLTCGSCHPSQAATQPATDMAHAMDSHAADLSLELEQQIGEFHYSIQRGGARPSYSVTDGAKTITLPIQWPFGRNSQTFVLEYNKNLYEGFVSYYPGAQGLDRTLGDQAMQPKTLEEAMGRLLSPFEAKSCFGCHSTGSIVNHELDLASMRPGITCERCHAGAAQHLESAAQGKMENLPANLKKVSAEDISTFCGQCHRTWQTVVRNRWLGVMNVRFQPYRLANSKCFDGIDTRMSCTACHDPHRQLVTDDKTYDAKCLACHGSSNRPPQAKVCSMAKQDCVTCHMPKTELAGAHRTFTDHQIRIMRAGEAFPN